MKTTSFLVLASSALATATKTCVVPSSGGSTSDSPAIQKVFDECSKDSKIVFQKGTTYNVFEPVEALNLENVIISVQGNLDLPQDIPTVQAIVKAKSRVDWFNFKGKNVKYEGSKDIKTGWIRSYGQAWWDANPRGSTGLPNRPHLMRFDVEKGSMSYFKSWKPIGWNVAVKGSDIRISHAVVEAVSETDRFPFNTDGFGIAAKNVVIEDCVIYNGDDAVAITDGAENVTFKHSTIGYETHGMSIGSLGKDVDKAVSISNIRFDDITVAGGLYAARLKSWAGGKGLVKNVEWSNIHLYNVTFPVFITQTYLDQNKENGNRPTNSSVNMAGFSWRNWSGSINSYHPGDGSCVGKPCWYESGLPSLEHNEAIIIACNTKDSCKDFEFKNIEIFPQDLSDSKIICMNAEANLNPKLGFECRNGTFSMA